MNKEYMDRQLRLVLGMIFSGVSAEKQEGCCKIWNRREAK